jgi:hypothetical protein
VKKVVYVIILFTVFAVIAGSSSNSVNIHIDASSHSRDLLAFTQTYNEDDTSNTQLVSIDSEDGTITPLGDTLETILPGYNEVTGSNPTLDPTGSRLFYLNRNHTDNQNSDYYIMVQDTQTGAILDHFPVFGPEYEFLVDSGIVYDQASIQPTPTPTPTLTITTFEPSDDTYVKNGESNRNTGAGEYMNIQSSGNNRALIKFDQEELQNALENTQIVSAVLKVSIVDNGNNWGTSGRPVDIHRITLDWTEGNGTESNRGNGLGATWNCAFDSLIENTAKNCSGAEEWEMGQPNNPNIHPWIEQASASTLITNGQSGVIEYDVTEDINAFLEGDYSNYGWIIKKTQEGQAGQVSFGTKESSSPPQLIVTYE